MELYDKKISEFVDWVTGEDTSDKAVDKQLGAFSTNGIPSSGKAIRELLQRKLKTPFVVYEDKSADCTDCLVVKNQSQSGLY